MRSKPFRTYTISFILLLTACYLCFWRKGIIPVYSIDGLGQYYPSFLYIGRTVREFLSSPAAGLRFYDLAIGMGDDVAGTLSYYGFGDPLNLISVFATASTGPYLFALTYYLRLYLGGLCFMLCCRRFMPLSNATVASALAYVFWGYGIYASGMYAEYAAMLYVLPLVLTGCEKMFRGEGALVLFLSAALLGLSGFYFTYICSLFIVVYSIVRLLFIYGTAGIREAIKAGALTGLVCLLGIGVSMIFMLPSVCAFLSSERESSSVIATLLTLSNYIPSLNRRFVEDANIMNAIRNYPVMIAAASVFIMPKSKRVTQFRIAVSSILILSYIPLTGRVFNGFSVPRDRWVFLSQFVLCVIFASIINDIYNDDKKKHISVFVMTVLAANIILAFWGRYSSLGENRKSMYVTADTARNEMESATKLSNVLANDNDLYRIAGDITTSGVNGRPKNNAMLSDYYGVSYWFSIVNSETQAFVDEATGTANDWRSYGFAANSNAYNMAAVKYHLYRDGRPYEGLRSVEKIESSDGTWTLYEDPSFAGFARLMYDDGTMRACEDITYDRNRFTFTIPEGESLSRCRVVTSIPYSTGWKAYINGMEASAANVSHFLGTEDIMPSPGDTVTLVYTSPGFTAGMMISIVCLFIFIIFALSFRKRNVTIHSERI